MPSHEQAPALALRSGVELAHAWVQQLADALGIRVLFLKGPTLTQQGLREERVSSDVDVLVEPDGFDRLCQELAERGWRERPLPLLAHFTSDHSRTYLHPRWPCDIDVHNRYPGMHATPREAFDAIWRARDRKPLAHRGCSTPNRVAGLMILALHSLRGINGQERHRAELAHLLSVPLTAREREALRHLAEETGATGSLRYVAEELQIPLYIDEPDDQLRQWRGRVSFGSSNTYAWYSALRRTRGSERAMVLFRAVWPSRADLLISRPETVDTRIGRLMARFRRLRRGVGDSTRLVRSGAHNGETIASALALSGRQRETRWN